jgi:RNA polymerase sigma-70 factor, ECF subfamily
MGEPRQEFESLFELYAKAIFRFLYFKVSDYELAQDMTEDTFLRVWKKLKNGETIGNPKALGYKIANGLAVDHYRKASKSNLVSLDEIDERMLPHTDDLDDRLDREQAMQHVYARLRDVKPEYREVILLYYIEELSVAEIAEILHKKENAVRVTIHRALQSLKEKM